MKEHSLKFDFSPKIIILLGSELIHDHKIAISELVKNAYDADANKVKLIIKENSIIIEDDGAGMDINIIKDFWLKPGTTTKDKERPKRTEKYKRLTLGEKGIGRFGIHRLGGSIELYSKTITAPEVRFTIDWSLFENKDNLDELEPIKVVENDTPKVFTGNKTGTQIIIRKLRQKFTEKDIKNVSSDLQKLLSPFTSIDNFNIEFFHGDTLFEETNLIPVKYIKEKSLISFSITINKDKITDFNYELKTEEHHKIKPRKICTQDLSKSNISTNLFEISKNGDPTNTKIVNLGNIRFIGYIYEYKLSQTLGQTLEKRIRDYLVENGGIRVYRDSMRVYNYGEEGKDNDILDLDKERAKRIGDHIGFNQLLASVELDRESSTALVEKTNREGFIHNEEFDYLRKVLNRSLQIVNLFRKDDKTRLSNAYFGKISDKGEITDRIKKMINTVRKLQNVEDVTKNKIVKELEDFSKDFENTKNIFLTASNTGLNLSFVVHEIDKILDVLEHHLKEKDLISSVSIFNHLKETVSSYKNTIKIDRRSSRHSLKEIVNQSIHNFAYRFECHEIEVLSETDESFQIVGKRNLIIGAILNIFDNSVWWLEYYKVTSKKIYIKTYQIGNDINLIIADNGKGFNISFESALAPFISGRMDDSSMGIGLHLADQIMQAHGGVLTSSSAKDEKLPDEFTDGAVLKLIFKNNKR